jgi:general secretion pathway protein A
MYEKRFGLARRPFPATPDPDRYYPATGHEAALATLERSLADDEGMVLLSGAPGTGKTLLGQVILGRLAEGHASALLTNSHLADRSALFQAILYDLGLPYADRGEQVLRLRLTDQLLKSCAAGKRTLLVVDEAQHLSADLLEELRLLTNLEAGSHKALQVVLIAQPDILDTLAQPVLAALQQRLVVRCRIEPLGIEEACDYLQHHLRQAGAQPDKVIDEAALEVLGRGCGGIPRRLNQAAHQALLLAEAGELRCVDAEAALESLSLLGLSSAEPEMDGMPHADEQPSVAGSIEAFEVGHRRTA